MVRPTDLSASGSHLCEEHWLLSVHAPPSLLRLPRPSSLTLPGLSPLSSPSPSPSPKSSSPSSAASPSGPQLRLFPPWRNKHNFDLSWGTWPGLWVFFAARRVARPSGCVNTPLTVVAAGMAKWLDIYSGVLIVWVLLSWFPNIPWDRQPLSAIRLCDLNLFRNIIPPVFDTLDVSPLLAFAVLGTLGSILNSSRMMKY